MNDIFDLKLFDFSKISFGLKEILIVILLWLVFYVCLQLIKRAINKSNKLDEGKKYSIYTLFKYIVTVFIIILSLQIVGLNLSLLLAGSAALLVGLGLGIQNLFSDYISGIIILFDSTIKVGDVIEVNGLVGRVKEINLRSTSILTRDDKFIILPNTDFTRNQLINWTHIDNNARFGIGIGLSFDVNIESAIEALKNAAVSHKDVLKNPVPYVRLDDFGSSTLVFTLLFWTDNVFRVERIKSEIRISMIRNLKEKGIEIPYQQQIVKINN